MSVGKVSASVRSSHISPRGNRALSKNALLPSEGAELTGEETIAVPACGWWALLALRALLTIWFATKD